MLPQIGVSNLLHCSFCGKSQAEARRLVAGPKNNICNECVIKLTKSPNKSPNAQSGVCDFCGKQFRATNAITQPAQAQVCDECLGVCQEIIADLVEQN